MKFRTDSSPVDPWAIAFDQPQLSRPTFEETLFALSNGTLGVRGGLEERPSATQGSFLSHVWERSPIEYHERFPGFARNTETRLPIPDGTAIRLWLGDAEVDLDTGDWLHFERRLDLRNGTLSRVLHWRSPQGHTLQIHAQRVVPLTQPALLCIRYRIHSIDYRGPVRLFSSLRVDHAATTQGHDPRIGVQIRGGLQVTDAIATTRQAKLQQHTQHSNITLLSGQRHAFTSDDARVTDAESDAAGVHQRIDAMLRPGHEIALDKFVAYAWSTPDVAAPDGTLQSTLQRRLDTAIDIGFDGHIEAHGHEVAQLWHHADLTIHGEPRTEQALRFNLFQVFQAVVRDGGGSVAAKGLTGEGYEGHYFWDAEAFALPALVFTAPQLARDMLMYRYGILAAARRHAREMNHARGALYAWRTISGDECSGYFPAGSAQYHINAAIAHAIGLYVDVTGDQTFLWRHGAEMLFETARLWLEVGHFNPRRDGAFCIHTVTGPDEYTALVDNNHYTNRMARQHLWQAARVAQRMRAEQPAAWAELHDRIKLVEGEPDQWQRAADAMYLPIDARLDIFAQDDTFLDKPRWPHSAPTQTRHAPLLLDYHPLSLYRHQVCKQADVLLALVLAGDDVDSGARRRNLDYYEKVTVHDSTLSASTFSIVAADVGDSTRAMHYFDDSLRVDLDDTHGNADHGLHMAAMAGSWMGLTWGFGGLRVRNGDLHLSPLRPDAWRGYRFGLIWRGRPLRVEVETDAVLYTLQSGPDLTIHHHGQPLTLRAGHVERQPLRPWSRPARRKLEAIIFDLDGVLADTAPEHLAAWSQLAGELGITLDPALGERLKGVDRATSLDIILAAAGLDPGSDERHALAARKNRYYRERIAAFTPEHLLPGAREALEATRAAGLRLGLASASRNAPDLLRQLGIDALFDHVVDAARIHRSKPSPDIFLAAAEGLGVTPEACLGVEDAVAGIAAVRAAGMAALGIGRPDVLHDADAVQPDLRGFDVDALPGMEPPSS